MVFKILAFVFLWSHTLKAGDITSRQKGGAQDSLGSLLQKILNKNFSKLQEYAPAPYFMAIRCHDSTGYQLVANKGAELDKGFWKSRHADVEIRVGSPSFDNNHFPDESYHLAYPFGVRNLELPLELEPKAVARILNTASDYGYRASQEAFKHMQVKSSMKQNHREMGEDFSSEKLLAGAFGSPADSLVPEKLEPFFKKVVKASEEFKKYPFIYSSYIRLEKRNVVKRFVSTETWSREYQSLSSLNIYAETQSEDGMRLWLDKNSYCRTCSLEQYGDSLISWIHQLANKLDSLRKSPVAEPYVGPVLLTSQAAAVFVHEVIGHRVEGHRQKDEAEGQTFLEKVGQKLLPESIQIYDYPGLKSHGAVELNGFYYLDDESIPAQKADIVKNGVFKGFLQSRSVVFPGEKSNGHGRANLGKNIVSRMGVTRLESTQPMPVVNMLDSLKSLLIKEGREFGYVVEDISGGYTLTDRRSPQSFKLEPLLVRKVYVDHRPSEVVRGLDVVGTPLVSLEQILAVGDDDAVFNGYCGAESGWVPVSSISPSLLFRTLEFEKKSGSKDKLPYLPSPQIGGGPR